MKTTIEEMMKKESRTRSASKPPYFRRCPQRNMIFPQSTVLRADVRRTGHDAAIKNNGRAEGQLLRRVSSGHRFRSFGSHPSGRADGEMAITPFTEGPAPLASAI